MKVTNGIKSEMEVSTINETYDASTMMFATDCIRSSNFRGMCTEASKWSEVCELCNKQNEICNESSHWMKCDPVNTYNEMSWNDIFDESTKCNEMKSVVWFLWWK